MPQGWVYLHLQEGGIEAGGSSSAWLFEGAAALQTLKSFFAVLSHDACGVMHTAVGALAR
jgi:hypothetical protein